MIRTNGDLLREGSGDGLGDVVLDGEDVFEGAIVGFRPGNVAAIGAHQARGDANRCAVFAHAAIEDVGDAEGPSDVADRNLFPL